VKKSKHTEEQIAFAGKATREWMVCCSGGRAALAWATAKAHTYRPRRGSLSAS